MSITIIYLSYYKHTLFQAVFNLHSWKNYQFSPNTFNIYVPVELFLQLETLILYRFYDD